jgi:hypothetical protein
MKPFIRLVKKIGCPVHEKHTHTFWVFLLKERSFFFFKRKQKGVIIASFSSAFELYVRTNSEKCVKMIFNNMGS